jgi:nitrogen fixation protein NifU and related proteins
MSTIRDLYQEVIFDHYRRPHNYHELPGADHSAESHNPLCGDHVKLEIRLENDVVKEVGFSGQGCAITTASASMMTDIIKGKTVDEVRALARKFYGMVSSSPTESETWPSDLGKLTVLAGVREFPARVKCATLPWRTLFAALHAVDETISTE